MILLYDFKFRHESVGKLNNFKILTREVHCKMFIRSNLEASKVATAQQSQLTR